MVTRAHTYTRLWKVGELPATEHVINVRDCTTTLDMLFKHFGHLSKLRIRARTDQCVVRGWAEVNKSRT